MKEKLNMKHPREAGELPEKNCRFVVLETINPIYVLYEDGSLYSRVAKRFLSTTENGRFYNLLKASGGQSLFSKDFLIRRFITKLQPLKNIEHKQLVDNSVYYVTKDGRIFSTRVYQFINPCTTRSGWSVVSLIKDKKRVTTYVAKVVWETFMGPIPKGYKISFKDNNKENCSLDNLELKTKKRSSKE